MGPSGAGKSSLLDCISGRNPKVEGSITVNGQPWSKRMKRFASYVMQDDLFYQTITVREHLIFQARLRMGKTHTVEQQEDRVNTVMEELGLTKCRDTLIGGPSLRGISGGERKRLSFAAEILTNPSLLFVDEPTSGLDSFMAETVVLQLQQLARDGRTVIATIHQPSSELFTLFDKLYLLSDGATVFHGKAADSVEYFASLGYQCPAYLNPSDYFMRQLVVMDKATDATGALVIGLVVGLIYLREPMTQTAIQNVVGVLFFLVVNQTFAAADPTFVTVPLELPIIEREYRAQHFHLLEWYVAKNVSELPLQVLVPVVHFAPVFLLVGIDGGLPVYAAMQGVLVLLTSAAVGLGYMVSCLCRHVQLAPTVGVIVILPMLLFGGLYVHTSDTPRTSRGCPVETCLATTGDGVLRLYGLAERTTTESVLLLVAVNLLFRAIGFVGLWLNLRLKT
ncbi:hypothetical protein PINS_up007568 [Pythium insidiosum]|nr:hypothetical protein PINS_up007568 [Pythium insidiosum]